MSFMHYEYRTSQNYISQKYDEFDKNMLAICVASFIFKGTYKIIVCDCSPHQTLIPNNRRKKEKEKNTNQQHHPNPFIRTNSYFNSVFACSCKFCIHNKQKTLPTNEKQWDKQKCTMFISYGGLVGFIAAWFFFLLFASYAARAYTIQNLMKTKMLSNYILCEASMNEWKERKDRMLKLDFSFIFWFSNMNL